MGFCIVMKSSKPHLARKRIFQAKGLTCCDPGELPHSLLSTYRFQCEPGSKIAFLPHSRVNAFKLSADLAAFVARIPLEGEFLSVLIRQFASDSNGDKHELLASIYPELIRLIGHGFIQTEDQIAHNDETHLLNHETISIDGWATLREITSNVNSRTYEIASRDEIAFLKFYLQDDERSSMEIDALKVFRDQKKPCFPNLIEHGLTAGRAYFLTSWIPGQPLSKFIELTRSGADFISLDQRIRICRSVLSAYSALHELGLLHLDVHPGNIMVNSEFNVVLCDFEFSQSPKRITWSTQGIERFYSPKSAHFALNGSDSGLCLDELDEQFSVAALIFEVLSGWPAHPTPAESDRLLLQICSKDIYSLCDRGITFLPEVDRAIRRAASLHPEERFSSISAFAREFEAGAEIDISVLNEGARRNSSIKALNFTADAILANCPDTFNLMNGVAGIFLSQMICARLSSDIGQISSIRAELELATWRLGGESLLSLRNVFDGSGGLFVLSMKCDEILGESVRAPNLEAVYGNACQQTQGVLHGPAGLAVALNPFWTPDARVENANYLLSMLDAVEEERHTINISHGKLGTLFALTVLRKYCTFDSEMSRRHSEFLDRAWAAVTLQMERVKNKSNGLDWSWCSGLSGALRLFSEAAAFDDVIRSRAEILARTVATEGAASDGSLCCGNAGQALALWKYSTNVSDAQYLNTARLRLKHADSRSKADHVASSLYYGKLGVDVVTTLFESSNPDVLNDICWLL